MDLISLLDPTPWIGNCWYGYPWWDPAGWFFPKAFYNCR